MLRALTLACLALTAAGCNLTTVESTWTNPALREKRITRVAVFGIAKNPGARIEFEESLTMALKDSNLNVVPGYDFVPFDEKPTREEVIERLKAAQVDGALVSRVVNLRVDDSRGPRWEGATFVAAGGYYGYWNTYAYAPVWRVNEGETSYDVETVLFHVEDDKAMWAARSSSKETSPKKLARAIGDAVIDAFRERNVAAPPGK